MEGGELLRVFEERLQRRILETQREELPGVKGNYFLSNTVWMTKSGGQDLDRTHSNEK
jgi:hypothetical protein